MLYKNSLFFFLFFLIGNIQAQEVWSLQKCVQYAVDNSLNIRQSNIAVQQAELTEDGSRYARLPNLNASSSYGYNFGLTIDPTSNEFINKAAGNNTWRLSSNVLLYNGGRLSKSIEQSSYDVEASQADLRQAQNDIALNVANAYINVMFAEEQLANAEKRIELTQAQLEQTQKLIRAGNLPENDKYDILANLAQNEQAIVVQQNSVDIAYLNLKQLLELDPNIDLRIDRPEITIPDDNAVNGFELNSIYSSALNAQPFVQADNLRIESAKLGVDIAKSAKYPSLSLFGSVDSRYSTEAVQQNGFNTVLIPQNILLSDLAGTLDINNIPQDFGNGTGSGLIGFENQIPILEDKPYFDQLSDNMGQSLGLSLNIPIYNNHSARINEERAELNIINAQINSQRNKQQLKTNIQTAIANAKAARKQLDAAERTRDAFRIAYENAQRRLELGAVNTFQVTTAKNSYDTAEVDYIVAKYDYIFKLKVVDYYQGNQISL